MVRTVPLDKIIVQGTDYRTHPRVAIKINKIGTDTTTASYLEIDGKVTGQIIQDVAPLAKDNTKINGPLDISRLPLVIPPDTDFSVQGGAGAKFRIIGTLYQLAPGEAVPGDLMARFNEQANKYIRYVTGTYSFGAATEWSAGTEVELYSLTPTTVEKYVFNDLLMIDYTGFTASAGDVAIKFYIDNNPLEYLESTNLTRGVDMLSIPHQDDVAVNEQVFTLKDFPIEVLGDHTLKITAENVSGSAISLSSASITLYAVAEYEKKG